MMGLELHDPRLWPERIAHPEWPTWVEGFRDHQIDAWEQIFDAYQRGVRVVVVDAPVGSGKTLLAEMVRRSLGVDGLFVCNSKSLQDQIAEDFDYARVLKGRSNYSTQSMPFPFYTTADCTVTPRNPRCKWCADRRTCPYRIARHEAMSSCLLVVNMAYFIREGQVCSDRELVIVDECDTLESVVMGAVEFGVSMRECERLRIEPPVKGAREQAIKDWIRGVLVPALIEARMALTPNPEDVKRTREISRLKEKWAAAKQVAMEFSTETWVRDYRNSMGLLLKPVTVRDQGRKILWGKSDRWLFMSGTVIDPDAMLSGLGINEAGESGEGLSWEMVTVPMTFPVENRPIINAPMGDMSRKGGDKDKGRVLDAVCKVLAKHPDEHTIIHTVSYHLTRLVVEEIQRRGATGGRRLWTYERAADRQHALDQYARHGGVLIGPSFDRGIDLPGDLCRVQVVVKMPFPNLGDRQVAERMRVERGWYDTETARTLVQMTGRGVRSREDYAATYILDTNFSRWFTKTGKRLLPKWWQEAIRNNGPRI